MIKKKPSRQMGRRLEETLTASEETVGAHLCSHQRNADQSHHQRWGCGQLGYLSPAVTGQVTSTSPACPREPLYLHLCMRASSRPAHSANSSRSPRGGERRPACIVLHTRGARGRGQSKRNACPAVPRGTSTWPVKARQGSGFP